MGTVGKAKEGGENKERECDGKENGKGMIEKDRKGW